MNKLNPEYIKNAEGKLVTPITSIESVKFDDETSLDEVLTVIEQTVTDNALSVVTDYFHSNRESLKGDKGEPTIVADSMDYPVGFITAAGWTDDVVYTNHGVWLKCAQHKLEIPYGEYPEMEDIGLLLPEKSIVPIMTSNTTPEPFVVSASITYAPVPTSPWGAFSDGAVQGWENGRNAVGDWLQISFGSEYRIGRVEINGSYAYTYRFDFYRGGVLVQQSPNHGITPNTINKFSVVPVIADTVRATCVGRPGSN